MTEPHEHPLAIASPPAWADAWGHDEYGPWIEFCVNGGNQKMRWIPPGCFRMGDDDSPFDNERPTHWVTLTRGYWLFDTPCTQALWSAVMADNPSEHKGETRPVEQVSWNDAQDFFQRFVDTVGIKLQLPTEAQWEYACRAGNEEARYGEMDEIAICGRDLSDGTEPVGSRQPNRWGLYDMLGNVYEWCEDFYLRAYSDGHVEDPVHREDGPTRVMRVMRGGAFNSRAPHVRAAYRGGHGAGFRWHDLGFRALSFGEPAQQTRSES